MTDRPLDSTIHAVLFEGVQSGARMISDMTGATFAAGMPHRLTRTGGISGLQPNTEAVISALAFGGDIAGGAALVVEARHAERLARGLMRSSAPPSPAMLLSAIEEAANVVAHDALAPMARELSLALMMAPPWTVRKPFGDGWSDLLRKLTPQSADNALVYTAPLRGWNGDCMIHFLLCLNHDFGERLAAIRSMARVEVGLGELKAVASPGVLRAASLGSCVAIILYDPLTRKGVMSHVVMPQSTSPEKAKATPGKFADTAVPALLQKIGLPPSRLQAWMVGGANMFYASSSPLLQVGQRNVERCRAALAKHGLRSVVEEVGKNLGRTVELFTSTGEVWVRSGPLSRRLPTPRRSADLKLPDQTA